ncbi:hypothetical protein R6Q57_012741 [Mikania cordata]
MATISSMATISKNILNASNSISTNLETFGITVKRKGHKKYEKNQERWRLRMTSNQPRRVVKSGHKVMRKM